MKKRVHAATVRFEDETWARVQRLASEDRRPVADWLRLLVHDAVADRSADRSAEAA